MPGGRGNSEDYTEKAADQAVENVKAYFDGESDECKAEVIAGVFAGFAAQVVPNYILEVYDYKQDYNGKAAKQAAKIVKKYFEDSSDECKAAAAAGVLAIFEAKLVKNYILDTDY